MRIKVIPVQADIWCMYIPRGGLDDGSWWQADGQWRQQCKSVIVLVLGDGARASGQNGGL